MSSETDSVFDYEFGFEVDLDRTTSVVVAMLGLGAVFWVLLYDGHVPMPGMKWLMMEAGIPMAAPGAMELGVFHVGTPGAVLGYLAMWGVMMWAMMHPAMTRFTREYAAAHDGGAVGVTRSLASFLAGYHLVWALSGLVPLAFHGLFTLLGYRGIYGVTKTHPVLVVGGALVLTGVYQLSAFKQNRLRDCCARVARHADAPSAAVRKGLHHGVRCVLVCFGPFFLLMPFLGEMNLFWMVALTTVVTVERLPTWGREVGVATGVVSLLAGLVVLLLQPDLGIAFQMAM